MIAAVDVLCEWLEGRALADLHGLSDRELRETVAGRLDEFPASRRQCADVVYEALRAAMAEFRRRRIEEFQGEKALLCTCFGISEETIAAAIAEKNLREISEVTELTRAGSGCGSCRMLIAELLDARHGP